MSKRPVSLSRYFTVGIALSLGVTAFNAATIPASAVDADPNIVSDAAASGSATATADEGQSSAGIRVAEENASPAGGAGSDAAARGESDAVEPEQDLTQSAADGGAVL